MIINTRDFLANMTSIIGIDARSFVRKPHGDTDKEFISAFGVGVKVKDYVKFDTKYREAISQAFKNIDQEADYAYYCTNDIKDWKQKRVFLDTFLSEIAPHIERVHCFYTLFSSSITPEALVYGRHAKKKKIKLAKPTMTYDELTRKHLIETFPSICAWRLTEFFTPDGIQFHLDYHSGHVFEAFEELMGENYNCIYYPSGDCVNPIISTADLLIDLIDSRFAEQKKRLLFENFRPLIPELGERLLVYPIWNKHLRSIVPIEPKSINVIEKIKHPVFWVFKEDPNIDSGVLKRSEGYRRLLDYAASMGAVVKLFEKRKDADQLRSGDYGVYFDSRGEETVKTYTKLGRALKPFKFDYMIPSDQTKLI